MKDRQQTKPGDVFGQCPKCGEQWELIDSTPAATKGEAPDKWECDHCGYTLSLAACVNACAGMADPPAAPALAEALRAVMWHLDARLIATPDTHAQEAMDEGRATLAAAGVKA
ncbi:unnamed protein product [marine sediment metagenome]|uniref:Uncharacterized protein n=1 Tax=marine sediment metagenome TaxID=412755 RepID=X0VC06_9ZZZZ